MHGGCNDVNNKSSAPEKIANEIADMAILCRDYGVNDVFISAMICRRSKLLNGKVKRVNFLLKQICEKNWYFFIDNSNIEIRDLWKDGIRLLELGKPKFAENFLYFLNNSYWLSPQDYFLEAHIHGNIEHTHSQLLNTKNCELISNKNILNANTSSEAKNENNVLKNLRLKDSNKVIIDHIKINSLRNKFELLAEMVGDKVDLLMISKIKLDSSFQNVQFYILKTIQTGLTGIAEEEV